VRESWEALGTQDQIAVIGLVVAVLAAIPAYLALRGEHHRRSSATTVPSPTEHSPYVSSDILREVAAGGSELAALFFKPIDQVPPPTFFEADPSRIDEFTRLLHSHGAVDPNATFVRVVVQGRSEASTVLTAVRIQVVERHDTTGGVLVIYAGGGTMEERSLHVDLDSPNPIDKPMPNDSGESWSFPLRVSSTEPEVLIIGALTFASDCSWFAELHYIAAGEARTVRIDDQGRPFRTAAPRGAEVYQPSPDGRSYVRTGAMR
jgi:hypothetical protein